MLCVQTINSVGKPINLFMSVLSGLCDLGAKESKSALSKLMGSKLKLVCIYKKEAEKRVNQSRPNSFRSIKCCCFCPYVFLRNVQGVLWLQPKPNLDSSSDDSLVTLQYVRGHKSEDNFISLNVF